MSSTHSQKESISQAVAKIHACVLSFVFAIVFGFGIFFMTAWLLIKGGENVGYHLSLLGQYFVGYSVSWVGSIIGLLYGVAVGATVGWAIGFVYNRIVDIRRN